MKLRARLFLTVALGAVPVGALALVVRQRLELSAAQEALADLGEWILDERTLQHLARDPSSWPPRRMGMRPMSPLRGPREALDGDGLLRGGRPLSDRGPATEGRPENDLAPEDPRAALLARRGPAPEGTEPPIAFAYDASFTSRNPLAPSFPVELRDALEAGAQRAFRQSSTDGRSALEVGLRTDSTVEAARYLLITRSDGVPRLFDPSAVWSVIALLGGVLATTWIAAGPLVARTRRLAREVREAAGTGYASGVTARGSDELTELATAFNEAGNDLRQALLRAERREQALRRFIENTGHDVGTPLTVLQGHLSALAGLQGSDPGPAGRELGGAVDEAQHIGALLLNLAAVAQLEDPDLPVRRDRLDLGSLVQRVVDRHLPLARRRAVGLECVLPGDPLHVVGDVTLLERALGNLVQNALRHGTPPDGSRAEVAVVVERHGERFHLRVLDNGPGVSEAEHPRLLERRHRGDDARQRHPDGQGLGLAIVRDVADRHGLSFRLRPGPEGVGLEASLEGPVVPD